MTTLALKTTIAHRVFRSTELALGDHLLKSGRYWYKGQQNCDLVLLRSDKETIIHASGGVRFRLAVQKHDDGTASGSLSLLGWLRETPNAIRIVCTLLDRYAEEIDRRRAMRLILQEDAESLGEVVELTEALGSHFSIKADENKLEDKDKISTAESERNFAMAVKTRWYHQSFASFCQGLGIKCYYRSAFAPVAQDLWEESVQTEARYAHALQ